MKWRKPLEEFRAVVEADYRLRSVCNEILDWMVADRPALGHDTIKYLRAVNRKVGLDELFSDVPIYRGYSLEHYIGSKSGVFRLKKKPAESWTTNPETALEFATTDYNNKSMGIIMSRDAIAPKSFITSPLFVCAAIGCGDELRPKYMKNEEEIIVKSQCSVCPMEDVELIWSHGRSYHGTMFYLDQAGYAMTKDSMDEKMVEKSDYAIFDFKKKKYKMFGVDVEHFSDIRAIGLDWKRKPNRNFYKGLRV